MQWITPSLMAAAFLSNASTTALAELTARVQPTPGGPQIHVNGKPVVPRWFFGSQQGGTVSASAEWTDASFDFSPGVPVNKSGTLHLRFSHRAGEVWLADVRICDAESGEEVLPPESFATPEAFAAAWNLWPLGEANTVGKVAVEDGVLHVVQTDPPNGNWPDFHLHSGVAMTFKADRRYRCSFRVRAVPDRQVSPALYRVEGGVWTNIGGPPGPFLQQVALARDAGVDFVSFSAPNCWTEPETDPNFEALDALCKSIVAVNPEVLLVPRVSANAPPWWLERHPEARMVYEGNKPGNMAAVSDRQYRADAAAHLEKLCRHLTEAFPEHFAGIHPCGQNTGEWFYEDSWERPLSGYDPATLQAWREWLRARGAADAGTAEVPSAESRHAAPFGLLRDPARERRLIDFARFQQEEMADMVLALAAAARRGSSGKKLVVFFYGYHYEFAALPNGASVSGHYALGKVLKSTDLDILCSPISYTDRQWPGTAPCMSPAESIRDAGIMWLNEDDTRTYLSLDKGFGALDDLQQTCDVMLRNTAQAALRGFATWWMDLPATGWFADPAIWEEMKRLRPVDEAMLQRAQPFAPEIAAILGEDSMCHLPGGANVLSRPFIYDARAALGRSGAPCGQYLLSEAIEGKVPAKLQFYLAAWALSSEQRQQLKANRRAGETRVWCYAPGYLSPNGSDLSDESDVSRMKVLTGFACRPVSLAAPVATPTDQGRKLGLSDPWGPDVQIAPLFTVEASPEETLATYSDGSPAVAVHRGELGTDVFVGVPQLTSALVRALARLAGAHLFTQVDAAVWAAEPYLSIHAMEDGTVTLNTGRNRPVLDALDGATIGDGPEVALPMRKGETRVLRY